jgi:hypothetical protein
LGAQWYTDIGYQLVVTMMLFSFQPFIDFIVENFMLKIYRYYYRKFVYVQEL